MLQVKCGCSGQFIDLKYQSSSLGSINSVDAFSGMISCYLFQSIS